MRIGLFGDIHANLIALDAVLSDLARERPDHLVCLGDLAITGPQPHEVVARLQELGCPVVRGNWDDWALQVRDGSRSYADCRPIDRWCAEQLTASDLAFFNSFLPSLEVPLPGGPPLLCYHGSPRDYNDCIASDTSFEDLDRMLDGRREGVLAGGHTHIVMLRRHGNALVLNPGSIAENWNFTARPETMLFNPHAEYALLESTAGEARVTFRRIPIDVDAVIQAAYECGMPDAEQWTALWLRDHLAT